MATGSELFSCLTCLDTTRFILLNIFSLLETLSLKILERPLCWHTKFSLTVAVRAQKHSLLKLSNVLTRRFNSRYPFYPRCAFSELIVVLKSRRFRLYVTVEEPDLAINMYKKLRQVSTCFEGFK